MRSGLRVDDSKAHMWAKVDKKLNAPGQSKVEQVMR